MLMLKPKLFPKEIALLGVMSIVIAASLCGGCSATDSNQPITDSSPTNQRQPVASSENNDLDDAVKSLQFSGYTWVVKDSNGHRVGPGPNYFSSDNVWVDTQGRLHLRIAQRVDGQWDCAEVISQRRFGYGTYRFYLEAVDGLDEMMVLGLFTWSDNPAFNHREIDIEVSKWGQADNKNGQFVVQPYTRNIVRFDIPTGLKASTHSFTWEPSKVFFQSLKGHDASAVATENIIYQHTFTQGIPQAGGENARVNFWLVRPPKDGRETEVIINKFEFIPLS